MKNLSGSPLILTVFKCQLCWRVALAVFLVEMNRIRFSQYGSRHCRGSGAYAGVDQDPGEQSRGGKATLAKEWDRPVRRLEPAHRFA